MPNETTLETPAARQCGKPQKPTLSELLQHATAMRHRLRLAIPPRGALPKALADDIEIADYVPVVLGYLKTGRAVVDGRTVTLEDIMIRDGILKGGAHER